MIDQVGKNQHGAPNQVQLKHGCEVVLKKKHMGKERVAFVYQVPTCHRPYTDVHIQSHAILCTHRNGTKVASLRQQNWTVNFE